MSTVKKQVLAPGTYWVDGQPYHVTRADIAHFYNTGNAMKDAGLSIPCPLEHQDNAVPLSHSQKLADSVKHNAGWVERWSIDEDGVLCSELNIPDDELVKKLPATIKFVSPEIAPHFTDGSGKRWDNVITHVALTTRPVWTKQKPFSETQICDSRHWSKADVSLRLSLACQVRYSGRRWIPKQPSLNSDLLRFSNGEIDMEHDDQSMTQSNESSHEEEEMDWVKELIADLAQIGIVLPEDTTDENLVERLCTAVKTHLATKNGTMAGDMPPSSSSVEEPKPEPITMSLQKELDALKSEFADERLKSVTATIETLRTSGKATPALAEQWQRKLTSKRLSLVSGDDLVVREVLAQIELAKTIPEGSFWSSEEKALRLSQAVAEKPPSYARWDDTGDGNGPLPRDKVKKLVEEQFAGRG